LGGIVESEMVNYEALDLMISVSAQFDAIVSYWISISLAVIAGCYVVRKEMSGGLAATLAPVYAIASAMFASRFYANMLLMSDLNNHPGIPQEFWETLPILGALRLATFLSGCLITELYVLYVYRQREST
jgi:hypothetical protein